MTPSKLPTEAQAIEHLNKKPKGCFNYGERYAYVDGFTDAIALVRDMLRDDEMERATKLHGEVMNIREKHDDVNFAEVAECDFNSGVRRFGEMAYKIGHRDARHAAAELVMKAFAEDAPASNVGLRLVDVVAASGSKGEG